MQPCAWAKLGSNRVKDGEGVRNGDRPGCVVAGWMVAVGPSVFPLTTGLSSLRWGQNMAYGLTQGCECGPGEGREDLVESEVRIPPPRFPEKHIQDRQIPETRYRSD